MAAATESLEGSLKDEEPFGLGCALERFSELSEVLEIIGNLENVVKEQRSVVEKTYERFLYILSQYQEQPHLLDPHVDELLQRFVEVIKRPGSSARLKHEIFKYMVVLINVRGYKVIVRHLPHEVSDFEPVLQLLEDQDPSDAATWTTRYALLLWLSIIVMIPFHMSRLDVTDSSQKPSVERLLAVCKTYVVLADKCQDAASYLTSRFLTRYDIKEVYLPQYLAWACELSTQPSSNVYTTSGCLHSIAMILKHGKREDLLPHASKLLQFVINADFRSASGSNVRKLLYKVVQRIGLTFLPVRVASWRYRRGNRSLAANLSAGDSSVDIGDRGSEVGGREEEEEEELEVPDEIEEVIDQLINGLRSGDSIVRWSAAKGVGRVTSRLPKDLADEVVGSVLELFSPREGDGAWHGGCLALAELGRRGLLLPQRLPAVVPLILKALVYDEPKGYASVGSHIRDAACYVCWSFARAYETHLLKPFVNEIASVLLIVTCFDKEINCRRAASAAFQENVGRQGTFPHGIDVLTTADFFSVSVRKNSYLTISVYIAQFEEYTRPLIDHLLERKVDHWDIAIRQLTANSLHNLTEKAPNYMIETVLPKLYEKTVSIDLNARHGSVLSIGEILYGLSKIDYDPRKQNTDRAGNLIFSFHERSYFRGMGGELMRSACLDFIEKCSLARLPFHHSKTIECWEELVEECLGYDVVGIRSSAVAALPAFLTEYFGGNFGPTQEAIVDSYIGQLAGHNQLSRMGHAQALGALPNSFLEPKLEAVADALIKAARISPDTVKWAECRRDAVKALSTICVNIEPNRVGGKANQIYECFLSGLADYTQDNRGDIGAWVREASMVGLQALVKAHPASLTPDLAVKVLGGIAQQSVERIDRTRALAGRIFYSFIHSEPALPNIANHEELKVIFRKEECDDLNWYSGAVTFEKFVQLLDFEGYSYYILLGLVSSVGGLTETLVKNSSAAFFAYLKTKPPAKIFSLYETILSIFQEYKGVDRVVTPMFKFLDKLLGSGCAKCIIDDSDSDFLKRTFKLIQSEITSCKEVYKLIDGIDALCQFLQLPTEVCGSALVQLSIFLCHRQRYVRRSTATRLYSALLVYGDDCSIPQRNMDEVMGLLSSTDWEQEVEIVRPIRNSLCVLMGVRVPVARKK